MDIETDPSIRKCMNIFRIIVFIIHLGGCVFLTVDMIVFGYDSFQIFAIVWLYGHMVLRMVTIFTSCYKPTECSFGVYMVVSIIWWIYGLFCWIFSAIGISYPYYEGTNIWWMAFVTFIFDIILTLSYGCYDNVKRREMYERERQNNPPAIEMIIIPTVEQHRFYHECAICTEKFKEDDMVKTLDCKHVFHTNCIDIWLGQKQSCPTCQIKI